MSESRKPIQSPMEKRSFSKGLAVMACAMSIFYTACSKSKSAEKVVAPSVKTPDVSKVLTSADSVLKANKGKGVITGFLTGEGASASKSLLKQASNAAGERRFLKFEEIPLSGANILLYNALKPTTIAAATTTTDVHGNYTVALPEGKYFAYAVYFDLSTFKLVTAQIPNINSIVDSIIKVDSSIAVEDVTQPTIRSVYDATSPDDKGVFLVGSIASTSAKINVVFSEPINRESVKGMILGKVDTTNTSTTLVLADTVKNIGITWSGDNKELTLNIATLAEGVQYGMIIPVSIKDLAKNSLEREYKATFITVSAKEISDVKFAIAATSPADKELIKPIQNPAITFNKPVEIFSILKSVSISPAINGFWEVSGPRAIFTHPKQAFEIGKTYTVTIPDSVKDISGTTLGKTVSYTFMVKDFDGAAKTSTGKDKEVALVVENLFDAYLQGDIGKFATYFHENFRSISNDGIKSKQDFLTNIRKDVGQRQASAAGFLAPIFNTSTKVCSDKQSIWKVAAKGGTADEFVWVDAYVSQGSSPRVYEKELLAEVKPDSWDKTGPRFTYKGKVYGFAPDFSNFHGPVTADGAKDDQRFFGDRLAQTSTVVLDTAKIEMKENFTVDGGISVVNDTAKVAVKFTSFEKYNRRNWGDMRRACETSLMDTSYQILKFVLILDGSKWVVLNVVSTENVNKENFNDKIGTADFQIKKTEPITLIGPLADKAANVDGKVKFEFKGLNIDSVGGYIIGLAEDNKFTGGRPPYGAVFFVKSQGKGVTQAFTLNSAAGLESGVDGTPILRRVQDLKLPGWDRTMYEYVLTKLIKSDSGLAGVYNWKVIAVKDTSAAQFLANGFSPQRYLGESDFGPARGHFAVKDFPQGAAFAQFESQTNFAPVGAGAPMGFGDMDNDGYPDFIEMKYATDPKDRNSYPDFKVDTDGDHLPDFIEKILDKDGKKGLVDSAGNLTQVANEIAALKTAGVIWEDADGDGFPNDIEQMFGFNQFDKMSNPGTRPKAVVPNGVFTGKLKMGSLSASLNMKVYFDTTKVLRVAYSSTMDKDTLVDTVIAVFSELSGELVFRINMATTGANNGRALLMRGHYDQIQSILQGPIDMIESGDRNSSKYGGGPNVGQFAGSGRGEDVSRFLGDGGNNGCQPGQPCGGATNNGPVASGYRLPPSGVNTGAIIVLGKSSAILMDEFKDTIQVFSNVNYRTQPDGSFDVFAEYNFDDMKGYHKKADMGGHLALMDSVWVFDGHFFQNIDSGMVHKSIPGQMSVKISKTDKDLTVAPIIGVYGPFAGWIQQDKFGTGLQGGTSTNPMNTMPCVQGQPCPNNPPPCDPAKPCTTNPPPCPAGQICNTNPPVNNPPIGGSFSRPYVNGLKNFKDVLTKDSIAAGGTFYVTVGNRVLVVINDSLHIKEATSPNCGQIIVTASMIPLLSDAPATEQISFKNDSTKFSSSDVVLIIVEDQFLFGQPARMEKIRDAQGEIRTHVFVVDTRPGFNYNTAGAMACTAGAPPNNNPPPCDPSKPCTPPPCDSLHPCTPPPCDPSKPCTPPPCDSLHPCQQGGPVLFKGTLDKVTTALSLSNNHVIIPAPQPNPPMDLIVNPASLMQDSQTGFVRVAMAADPAKFVVFNGDVGDPTKLMLSPDNKPLVTPK